MIYFLSGTDEYRILEKAEEIKEQYHKKYPELFGFEHFELSEKNTFDSFKNFFSSSSMFALQKLAIADDVFQNPEFSKIASFLKKSKLDKDKEKNLILIQTNFDKTKEKLTAEKKDFLNYLKKTATCQNFSFFKNFSEALPWLKKELKKHDINIDLPALKILFENFANDSYGLINELIKLSLYEPNKKITLNEVKDLSHFYLHPNFFAIYDDFFNGNKKQMIFNIEKSIKSGVDEGQIFNYFIKQIRAAIYILKHQTKKIDLPPFAINKIRQKLLKWPDAQEKMLKIYDQLSKIDWLVKKGVLDYQTALEILIIEIKLM